MRNQKKKTPNPRQLPRVRPAVAKAAKKEAMNGKKEQNPGAE